MYNTRFICGYSEEEERSYYREMRRITLEETGVDMKGMGGPGPQKRRPKTCLTCWQREGFPITRTSITMTNRSPFGFDRQEAHLDAVLRRGQRRARALNSL